MTVASDIILLPDAGPLITLAYAEALDVLFKPGWTVRLVDMVLAEVTRQETPTSHKLKAWSANKPVIHTRTFDHYQAMRSGAETPPRTANLGELAIQEVMHDFALAVPPVRGVFLFEDHKIARAGFLLPENCQKVSTRAFLLFLEQHGWIDSAADIEAAAIRAGRNFSRLRFPP
ncbi:MAG TPA: hypothetical protein VFW49_15520 [Fluviicoccus sp.]|nr:hypothetical protein [Fluviicoccus sp.]